MGEVVQFRRRTSRAVSGSNRKDAPGDVCLTEVENQFFEVFWKALHESGQEPPPELNLPGGTRVVHRALVSKAYRIICVQEDGSQPISANTIKSRWRRSTRRLLEQGVIGFQEPFLWHTGKSVLGKLFTQQPHRPGGAA